jgi:hypothetical protein
MIHNFYGTLANTPITIKNGLMNITTPLSENQGMLFAMNKLDYHKFWMKNTYIPLDVIFLNSNFKVLGFITNNKPLSLTPISINKKSKYILEINAGGVDKHNIKINDYIKFYV